MCLKVRQNVSLTHIFLCHFGIRFAIAPITFTSNLMIYKFTQQQIGDITNDSFTV